MKKSVSARKKVKSVRREPTRRAKPSPELRREIKAWAEGDAQSNTVEALRPDYASWFSRSAWTTEEAVILSLARDPNQVDYARDRRVAKSRFGIVPAFIIAYDRRLNRVKEAFRERHLKLPIEPTAFLKWAQERRLSLPGELLALSNNHVDSGEAPVRQDVLNALLLAIGIHFDGNIVQYRSTVETRSRLAGQIAEYLRQCGLTISQQSIRDHLVKATEWVRNKNGVVLKAVPLGPFAQEERTPVPHR
jgi:hypothetical protein